MAEAENTTDRRTIGTIKPAGDRKWVVRVYLGLDAAGKRKYHTKTVSGIRRTAERYLAKVVAGRDGGTFVAPVRETVSAYMGRWLEAVRGSLRVRTHHDYAGIIRRYIEPAIGTRRLSALTSAEIQTLYSDMLARGLSARTVRYTHAVLNQALAQAVGWGVLATNPANTRDKRVKLPQQQRREMQVLNAEQVRAFLTAAKSDRFYALWMLLIDAGLRPEEALALRWRDIDGDRIQITRVVVRDRAAGKWRFEEPKTDKSRRSIPITEATVAALRAHRKQQAGEKLAAKSYDDAGLVFATRRGGVVDLRRLHRRYFKPLLERAELPDIRLYDLRHTCATLLLLAGENPKVVSERLGHSTIGLTMDTYSHVLPDLQEQAAEKMARFLA